MMRRKPKPAAGDVRSIEDGVFGARPVLPEGLALLALAAPLAPPPPVRVKVRLLARIRPKRHKAPVPAGGRFESVRASEGWRETFPGGRCKTLAVDDEGSPEGGRRRRLPRRHGSAASGRRRPNTWSVWDVP